MAGTAVLRMVVSSDSMKKATATSHGRSRLLASDTLGGGGWTIDEEARFMQRNRRVPEQGLMHAIQPKSRASHSGSAAQMTVRFGYDAVTSSYVEALSFLRR